ncbi:hypothetical protein [Actinophytocola sp.]|uniref:hypothetical protein n=1 Tax=Actinophytocola sp. TaxID=1872138 RepID=UPI00389A90FC
MNTYELVAGYDIYTTAEELSVAAQPAAMESIQSITTPSPLCPTPCVASVLGCV